MRIEGRSGFTMKRIGAQSLAILCTLWALTGCDAVFGFEERPFVPSPGTGGTGAGGGSTTMVGVGGGGGNATATGGSGAGGQTTTASGGGAPLFDKTFVLLKQTFRDNQLTDSCVKWKFRAYAMVSSLDPLPATARALMAIKCWDASYQQELCTGMTGGVQSAPITHNSPTDQWLERTVSTTIPSGTVNLEFVLQLNHCDTGACSDVGGTVYWDDVSLLHDMMDPGYLNNGGFESELNMTINWAPYGGKTAPPDPFTRFDLYSNYQLIAHGEPLKASANPNNLTFDGYMMSQGLWMRSHFAPSP